MPSGRLGREKSSASHTAIFTAVNMVVTTGGANPVTKEFGPFVSSDVYGNPLHDLSHKFVPSNDNGEGGYIVNRFDEPTLLMSTDAAEDIWKGLGIPLNSQRKKDAFMMALKE